MGIVVSWLLTESGVSGKGVKEHSFVRFWNWNAFKIPMFAGGEGSISCTCMVVCAPNDRQAIDWVTLHPSPRL